MLQQRTEDGPASDPTPLPAGSVLHLGDGTEPAKVKLTGIAVVGSNPQTVTHAPFGDESWLIYACSPHNVTHRKLPRVTEWFEVHDTLCDPTRPYEYLRALEDMPLVWMRDKENMKCFANARLYPEEELKGTSTRQKIKRQDQNGNVQTGVVEIPNGDGLYCPYMFTSSIAYMLAKAIVDCEKQSIPQIGIWGVMQASETEYVYQRPGIQYFIHQAAQRGIKVIANRESCLFDMPQWKW